MPPPAVPDTPLYRGLESKRHAIAKAALAVFLRDGYARASVDTVAAQAGVSKRTLYNHFKDKESLFLSVVTDMTTTVVARFAEIAEKYLSTTTDLERDLVAFGKQWVSDTLVAPDRAALRRLLIAEAGHFPALVPAWRRSGPEPSQEVLAAHLSRIAERGLLDIDDPAEAAEHLSALVLSAANGRSLYGTVRLADDEVDALVTSGVRAFLRIYRPAP